MRLDARLLLTPHPRLLNPAWSRDTGQPRTVLFACVENSNRSQMAGEFARVHGGEAGRAVPGRVRRGG